MGGRWFESNRAYHFLLTSRLQTKPCIPTMQGFCFCFGFSVLRTPLQKACEGSVRQGQRRSLRRGHMAFVRGDHPYFHCAVGCVDGAGALAPGGLVATSSTRTPR